jgi:hypothetical protein
MRVGAILKGFLWEKKVRTLIGGEKPIKVWISPSAPSES